MSAPVPSPGVTPLVTLVPGSGIVIRKPAFLCVLGDNARALLPDILAIEDAVATADRMPRRGRHVVRAVAQLAATADLDQVADIGFAAPDSVGIAIYLSGAVFGEADGRRLRAEGSEPFDRAIPWPYEGLGLYLDDAVPAEPGEETYDLVEGFVPAAGALLHTPLGMRGTEVLDLGSAAPEPRAVTPQPPVSQPPAPQPPAPQPPAPEPEAPQPVPDPSDPAHLGPDHPEPTQGEAAPPVSIAKTPEPPREFRSSSLAPDDADEPPRPGLARADRPAPAAPQREPGQQREPLPRRDPSPPPAPAPNHDFRVDSLQDAVPEQREPLPVQEKQKPATEVVKIVESRAHVHGIRCSRGHLNHPRSWLCGVCGIRMDQLTGILVEGERPPLGWLLLDNGSTYLLDEDLVIGREPGAPTRPGRGAPKPIRVQDESGQLSRRHIEIRLVEWDVHLIDLGSANGTYVSDPAMGNREIRLTPRQPHLLTPGSHVRIGGRHFIFESPHARA
ncbi:FHA domain-containing protein [Gordonia sp. L191]|uniref:FHA domain-containing protein n=1 Tax=Gordonia sp. L191 TaxID=2982699 RepID=UPI0024BFEB60|nr:FHA domain-containing protein [Gordonia sp. L191]WHU45730.1 FHA domain-containing protein [Gordonia sp. L191]